MYFASSAETHETPINYSANAASRPATLARGYHPPEDRLQRLVDHVPAGEV